MRTNPKRYTRHEQENFDATKALEKALRKLEQCQLEIANEKVARKQRAISGVTTCIHEHTSELQTSRLKQFAGAVHEDPGGFQSTFTALAIEPAEPKALVPEGAKETDSNDGITLRKSKTTELDELLEFLNTLNTNELSTQQSDLEYEQPVEKGSAKGLENEFQFDIDKVNAPNAGFEEYLGTKWANVESLLEEAGIGESVSSIENGQADSVSKRNHVGVQETASANPSVLNSTESSTPHLNGGENGQAVLLQEPIAERAAAYDKEDALFVLKAGESVEIDGQDGYDHIDLACFSIEQARILNDRIIIFQNGTSMEVRYRNIRYLLFADDVRVDL